MDRLIKGSNVLIPWSGGLDSTYLVNLALDTGCNVTVAYFEIKNNDKKTICEHNARRAMHGFFVDKANRLGVRFSDIGSVFSFHLDQDHFDRQIGDFTQTPLWMLASAYIGARYDQIAMGFVMGDETVSWYKEYKNLFNAYSKIKHDHRKKSKCKLIFPIMKTKKDYIWHNGLPEELKPNIWFCENPVDTGNGEYRQCYKCKPCKTSPAYIDYGPDGPATCIDDCKDEVNYREEILDVRKYAVETIMELDHSDELEIYPAS